MSATTSPTPGWTEPRVRRARMFAVLIVACAIAGLWALYQPWFAWATPGLAASCEPAPSGAPSIALQVGNRETFDGISARGCINGAQTVAAYDSAVGTGAGVSAAQQSLPNLFHESGPSIMLGLPRAATMLFACLALGAFGVASRRGLVLVVSVLFLQVPHRDITSLRLYFLDNVQSSMTISMPGLQVFTWALMLGSLFLIASTFFVLKVNFETRKAARKAARAAGVEDPAEPLDFFTNYVGRKIGKVKAVAEDSASRAPAAATQTVQV